MRRPGFGFGAPGRGFGPPGEIARPRQTRSPSIVCSPQDHSHHSREVEVFLQEEVSEDPEDHQAGTHHGDLQWVRGDPGAQVQWVLETGEDLADLPTECSGRVQARAGTGGRRGRRTTVRRGTPRMARRIRVTASVGKFGWRRKRKEASVIITTPLPGLLNGPSPRGRRSRFSAKRRWRG